jgi:hypothetical protein
VNARHVGQYGACAEIEVEGCDQVAGQIPPFQGFNLQPADAKRPFHCDLGE